MCLIVALWENNTTQANLAHNKININIYMIQLAADFARRAIRRQPPVESQPADNKEVAC